VSDYYCDFLGAQSSLVRAAGHTELPERAIDLKVVLLACCSTAVAISRLGKQDDLLNECVMLARALLERAVNFCYLLVCDNDEWKRYWQYTKQKSFRKLNRSFEAAGRKVTMEYSGLPDPSIDPVLKEAIDAFTGPKGGEKTRWSTTSLSDRIGIIAEKEGVEPAVFLMNEMWVFEDASEALHGTFYGCSFHTGIYEPSNERSDPEDLRRWQFSHLSMLTWGLGQMLHTVILLLDKRKPLGYITATSQANFDASHTMMRYALSPTKDDSVKEAKADAVSRRRA